MKTRSWIILGSVVAGLALVWVAAGGLSSGTPVRTAGVAVGPIRQFVDEQAVTRLPESYLVTMPYAGRIQPIALAEGTVVQKGQPVAEIVTRDLELDVEQAKTAVARLEASIRENAFIEVEKTALNQTLEYVKSMQSTVEAAVARADSSQAAMQYAETYLARVQRLFDTKAASQDDLDRAVLQKIQSSMTFRQDRLISAASAAIQAATNLMPDMVRQYIERKGLNGNVLERQKAEAEVQLQKALDNRARGTMRSPVDGVVLARQVSNERFLAGGAPLLEIGDLDQLEVEADVLSLDVVRVKPGDRVEIYGPAIGKTPARGTVTRIYPAGFTKVSSLGVEQQRVKVIVRFDSRELQRVRQRQNLGVGYRVRVRIVTAEKADAKVIPRSAMFRNTDGSWQVYAVRNGRARVQKVTIGLINDEQAEVLAGLERDESVIRSPESSLLDGQRVWVEQEVPERLEAALHDASN
jgi:HlyD family secretion protein